MSLQQVPAPLESRIASEAFQEALQIAARNADDVDLRGRFPREAVDALRTAGALGWHVPLSYGGAGAHIEDLADATFELSRRCASTGMIFAMHQIQVASIVRHKASSSWFENTKMKPFTAFAMNS